MTRNGATTTTTKKSGGVVPTAEIRTSIFTPVRGGQHFEWHESKRVRRVRVHVYSEQELTAELAAHAPRAAIRLEDSPADSFRLTAHCLTTGRLVGEWTWKRSEETGAWLPAETPWAVWDDRLRVEALERLQRAS